MAQKSSTGQALIESAHIVHTLLYKLLIVNASCIMQYILYILPECTKSSATFEFVAVLEATWCSMPLQGQPPQRTPQPVGNTE